MIIPNKFQNNPTQKFYKKMLKNYCNTVQLMVYLYRSKIYCYNGGNENGKRVQF